jgi:hypothetical protein
MFISRGKRPRPGDSCERGTPDRHGCHAAASERVVSVWFGGFALPEAHSVRVPLARGYALLRSLTSRLVRSTFCQYSGRSLRERPIHAGLLGAW